MPQQVQDRSNCIIGEDYLAPMKNVRPYQPRKGKNNNNRGKNTYQARKRKRYRGNYKNQNQNYV